MSDAAKTLVREYLDTYNRGEWDELDRFVSADYAHHNNDAVLDLAQFKRGAAWMRAAMPDFRLDVVDMFADGDQVASRLLGTGTHANSLFGEAPTGQSVVVHVIVIHRLDDGVIAEDWEAMDVDDLQRQLRPPA